MAFDGQASFETCVILLGEVGSARAEEEGKSCFCWWRIKVDQTCRGFVMRLRVGKVRY